MSDALFASHRARLLDLLRRLSYQEREVVLASGKKSNFYIDCRQTVLTAEGHFLTGWLLNALLAREAPEVAAVGGPTMGADPLCSATSFASYLAARPLNAFYIRKEPKGHGTGQYIEGLKTIAPGTKVAILEDVVTTGASTLTAITRARDAGLEVVRVCVLVDRQEGGREAVEQQVPLSALYTREDFR
ncbi:MAG TPA: orotate phosphoribosyltransferase [Polyangia bacterium]